jgi:hypothetical protein
MDAMADVDRPPLEGRRQCPDQGEQGQARGRQEPADDRREPTADPGAEVTAEGVSLVFAVLARTGALVTLASVGLPSRSRARPPKGL